MTTVTADMLADEQTDPAEELARIRRAIEREIENAEVVTFETSTRSDFRCPMVAAATLRDILDGRIS